MVSFLVRVWVVLFSLWWLARLLLCRRVSAFLSYPDLQLAGVAEVLQPC